jgi:hypothetical protein
MIHAVISRCVSPFRFVAISAAASASAIMPAFASEGVSQNELGAIVFGAGIAAYIASRFILARPQGKSVTYQTKAGEPTMWIISGPAGMTLEDAKRRLRVHAGPQDYVLYQQQKNNNGRAPAPRVVSRQPLRVASAY